MMAVNTALDSGAASFGREVDGDERNESRRRRTRGLSMDDRAELDDLISNEPLRPMLGPNTAVLWKTCSAFLERNDIIPDGNIESRSRLRVSSEVVGRSRIGLEGYDCTKGLDCGFETSKAIFESDKRCCSRMRERCT